MKLIIFIREDLLQEKNENNYLYSIGPYAKKDKLKNYLYSIGPYAKKKNEKNLFVFDRTICKKSNMKIIICTR